MYKKLLILPAAFLAFACSKGDNKMTAADSALNSDLSTAAASRPYTPLDSITAAERAGVATSTAPATALRSTSSAPRTTVRRTSAASLDNFTFFRHLFFGTGLQRSRSTADRCEAHQT